MPWLEVDGLHFGYLPGQPLFRAWSARVGPGVTLVQGGPTLATPAPVDTAILTAGSWVIFILGLKLTIPLWPSFIGN